MRSTPRAKDPDASIAMLVRSARGMLGWSQADLAERSSVAERTVLDLEIGLRIPRDGTVDRLVATFAAAGVELIEQENGIGLFLARERPPSLKLSFLPGHSRFRQVST